VRGTGNPEKIRYKKYIGLRVAPIILGIVLLLYSGLDTVFETDGLLGFFLP
jgi:hypothetical protein